MEYTSGSPFSRFVDRSFCRLSAVDVEAALCTIRRDVMCVAENAGLRETAASAHLPFMKDMINCSGIIKKNLLKQMERKIVINFF